MRAVSNEQDIGDQARSDLADLIDLQMSPLGVAAMNALDPTRGQTILDVGCGAGQTLLQLVDRTGPTGRVIGVDIAPRVLAVAQTKTSHRPQVTLLQADAAKLTLPDQSLDGIFSRFGMMFFADPIDAFSNMHRMLKNRGRVGFVCWRSIHENELDSFPVGAAGLTINVDSTHFSFEKADTIDKLLRSTGFGDIAIEAHDTEVSCGDTNATLKVLTRVGALGKFLRETPSLLPEAEPRVRAALKARERKGKVSLGAATWIVTAAAE